MVAERRLEAGAPWRQRQQPPLTHGLESPPVTVATNVDREAWVNFDQARYMDLCATAYQDGDFSYVQTALRANHEVATAFINDRVSNNVNEITGQ